MLGAILLILITILMPPIGVFLVSGCSVDLLINICLTLLGYLPGHIHAFWVEWVYYHRKEQIAAGLTEPAWGVYSDRVQQGREQPQGYGTIA